MNMLDGNLPERSSCRGRIYKAPASCSDPRRVSDLLGAVGCDPQPSPVLRVPLSGIPRRADEAVKTSYLPFASGCYNLVLLLTGSLPDAGLCVPRSTSALRERGSGSPDVCREPWVCTAYPSPPIFPIRKAPEVLSFEAYSSLIVPLSLILYYHVVKVDILGHFGRISFFQHFSDDNRIVWNLHVL